MIEAEAFDYSTARQQVRTGDVLLFRRSSSLLSRLICRWTESKHSHAGLALWAFGRLWVIEACWPRVRLFPLSRYSRAGIKIDWYRWEDVSTAPRCEAALHALEHVGDRYASLLQMAGSFVPGLARFLANLKVYPGQGLSPNRPFCSCLVTAALIHAGLRLSQDDPASPWLVAPGDIALFNGLQRKGLILP
jgi:Permuted papain-like amidase enzyme, YaeF/YiiX, C92 family